MAPQLTAMNGRSRRAPRACSARATSSFPEPLSPVMSVAEEEFAKCSMSARTRSMALLTPTMRGRASVTPLADGGGAARATVLAQRRQRHGGRATGGFSMGLQRKSKAPACKAATAISTVALPVIMMASAPGWTRRR